jgi:hypothetical protein
MAMRLFYLAVLIFFLAPLQIFSQALTTKGKEFWVGIMENADQNYNLQTEWISLYISSQVSTSGSVTVPLQGFSQNFTVVPNAITEVRLPINQVLNTGSDQIQRRGIFVTANDTINVYGINYKINTEDATVILPLHTLREDYYVMSYKEEGIGSSEFLIVAVEDNTVLEITPTAPVNGGRPQGIPYSITMNKGETYQAQSVGDLTGTRITIKAGNPCKKFAVFGGNTCSNVGNCGRCDHLYEQMFPINTWGYTYIVSPLKTRTFDKVRIMASENNTTVRAGFQNFTLNAGEYQDIEIRGTAVYIQGSKPILVAQFSVGGCCEAGVNCRNDEEIYADPFMLLVSSVEQMAIKRSTFSSFNIRNIDRNFINIVIRTNFVNQVKRNGVNIPANQFRPVPSRPEFSYAQLEVPKGTHRIEADSGVIAYAYGFGERDSYGYSGDVVLNNIALRIESIDEACVGQRVQFKGVATRTITEWKWTYGTEQGGSQQTDFHTFSRAGTYTVKLVVKREGTNCVLDSTTKEIRIKPTGESPDIEPGTLQPDQTICPGRPASPITLSGQRAVFYEWQVSKDRGQTWTKIPNNDNLPAYQPQNITSETWYRVRLTDGGCGEEFSPVPLKITLSEGISEGRIEGGQTVCADSVSPTLRLVGYGNASVVRWEQSQNGNDWTPISNTTRTLSPGDRRIITRTTYYRAVLNFGPCGTATTETTTVVLKAPSIAGTITGGGTVCPGGNKNLTLSGHRGLVKRWEFSTNGQNWQTIPGSADKTELQVSNPNTTQFFRVVVQNLDCEPAVSETTQVRLLEGASAGILEGGKSVCALSTEANLTLRNSSGTILRWESSTNDGTNWTSIAHTASTYNPTNITQTTSFRVMVGGACGDVFSNSVKIQLTPPTVAGTILGANSVCQGKTNIPLILTGHTGNIVTWESNSDGGSNFRPVTGSEGKPVLQTGNLTTTTRFRVRLQSGNCEPAFTPPVEVKVTPLPDAGTLTGDKTFCALKGENTLTLGPSVGTIDKWEYTTNEGATWVEIKLNENTYNTGEISVTTWYRVILKTDCGKDTSNIVKVSLTAPSAGGDVSGTRTVCGGNNNIKLDLVNHKGTVTGWESSTDGVTWKPYPSSNTATLTIVNLTQTTSFRATVKNGQCEPAVSKPAKVTIDGAVVEPGTLTGDTALCSASLSTVIRLKDYSGYVYRYEASTDSGRTWRYLNITNPRDTLAITGQTKTTYYRALVKNGDCAEAYTNMVKIINKPITVAGELGDLQFVCQNANAKPLELKGYQGVIVAWEQSPTGYDNWQTIANITTPIYDPGVPTAKTFYRVKVQNGDCADGYSNIIYLDISLPTEPGEAVGGDTSCIFATPEISLKNYRGRILHWEKSTDGGNIWDRVSVFTHTFIADTVRKTTLFRAVVKNGGCPQAYSQPTEVFIRATKSGKITPASSTICLGERAPTLTLSDIDTLVILGWQVSKDLGRTWTDIGKAGLSEVRPGPLTITTWFRAKLELSGCPPFYSPPGKINVINKNHPNGNITGTTKVCRPLNTVTLKLNNFTGTIDRWEYSSDRWATVNTLTTPDTTITVNNLTETTQFRAITRGQCGERSSIIHVVDYNSTPIKFTAKIIPGCNAGRILAETDAPGPIYSIDPPVSPPNRTGLFTQLPVGTYKITVKDSTGCEADTTIQIVSTRPDPPVVLKIDNISFTGALVTWRPIDGQRVTYHIRYRIFGAPTWNMLSGITDTSRLLVNLSENTRYEVQVAAQCPNDNQMTDWSVDSVRFFKTLAKDWDCTRPEYPIPSGFYVGDVTPTTVTLHWNPIPTTIGYIISYGMTRQVVGAWTQIVVCHPDTFVMIQNLNPNTFYGVRMRTNCSNCITALNIADNRSAWTGIQLFRTLQQREEIAELNPQALSATLYPNPNNGTFTLNINGKSGEKVVYRLMDISGREVYRGEETITGGEINVAFHDRQWASGLYIWSIQTQNETQTIKMIVE